MDTDIELHDKMLLEMQKSFKKLKKRIHKVELNLHLIPPDSEPVEMALWKAKVDKLLVTEQAHMDFPCYENVHDEWLKKHPPPIYLSNGEQIVFLERDKQKQKMKAARAIPAKTLKKLAEIRETKNFGVTKSMGSMEEGQELKTIKNYSGCNTLTRNTRVLVRKDARIPPDAREGSSLPPRFGPGTYDNTDPKILRPVRSPRGLESSFKAPERYAMTSDDFRERQLVYRSWSSAWSLREPPEEFRQDTRNSTLRFASNSELEEEMTKSTMQWDTIMSETRAQTRDRASTWTPTLGSRDIKEEELGENNKKYKVKDWTRGGLSQSMEVFDSMAGLKAHEGEVPGSSTFLTRNMDASVPTISAQTSIKKSGVFAEAKVDCHWKKKRKDTSNADVIDVTRDMGSVIDLNADPAETIVCVSPTVNVTTVEGAGTGFINENPSTITTVKQNMSIKNQKKGRNDVLKKSNKKPPDEYYPPINIHKILHRGTSNLKHSNNIPVPVYRHKSRELLTSTDADGNVSPTALSPAKMLHAENKPKTNVNGIKALPLKADIGPALKQWYKDNDIKPYDVTYTSSKRVHVPMKPALDHKKIDTTSSSSYSSKVEPTGENNKVKVVGAEPIVDFTKKKFMRLEREMSGLLLPNHAQNKDGAINGKFDEELHEVRNKKPTDLEVAIAMGDLHLNSGGDGNEPGIESKVQSVNKTIKDENSIDDDDFEEIW